MQKETQLATTEAITVKDIDALPKGKSLPIPIQYPQFKAAVFNAVQSYLEQQTKTQVTKKTPAHVTGPRDEELRSTYRGLSNLKSEPHVGRIQGLKRLHVAISAGTCDELLAILLSGADINWTLLGRTALHQACAAPSATEKIKLLLNCGADINFISLQDGYTPIMCAVEAGNLEAVKLLAIKGADCKLSTLDGKTLDRLAMDSNKPHVLCYLRSKMFSMERCETHLPTNASTPQKSRMSGN